MEVIRKEGGKQLDAICKYNTNRIKRIGFYDKENKKAVELSERINKIIKDNKNKLCVYSFRWNTI